MTTDELTLPFGDSMVLPVRAIPYVTYWELSPTSIASALARNPIDVVRCLSNRFSYRLVGGELEPVLRNDWNAIIKKLGALDDSLNEKYPDEGQKRQGQSEWMKKAIVILPAGVFVWLDEFKADYGLEVFVQRTRLTFKPLISSEERTEVMEGFESFTHLPQAIIAVPVSHRQVSAQNAALRAKRELARQRAEADYRREEAEHQANEAQLKLYAEELAGDDAKPFLAMISEIVDLETAEIQETPATERLGISSVGQLGGKMKKAALVKKYKNQWRTVEADIGNASRSELKKASLGGGYYDVATALEWARQEGKINEATPSATPGNSILASPISVKHTLS